MKSKNNQHFETMAIRTQTTRSQFGEHATPLYLTSSFVFRDSQHGSAMFAGEEDGYLYSRFSNPTCDEFVDKLCLMEGAETGISTATGMAAVFVTLASVLQQGDHFIASRSLFGNTLHIITNILPKWGIEYTLVDISEQDEWEKVVKSNTRLLFIETPSNPGLDLINLEKANNLCKSKGLLFCVDNCFATPYLQKPIDFGADIVIHSATKYLDGQGRVMGGAVLGKENWISKAYEFLRRTGPSLSPFNAWVLSKSLETLAVRMDKHCENALKLAEFLELHEEVDFVTYPFLPAFKQFDLAKKQMKQGGGLVSCDFKGGRDRGMKLLDALQMISLTANLGDTRTIATHPSSTTHSKLTDAELEKVGITKGLIRFSVGLEHIDDIIRDIDLAINASKNE